MEYLTCCVQMSHVDVPDLQAMIDTSRQITYRTARKRIGKAPLAETFPCYDWNRKGGLTMARDWHVGYYRSIFRGKPCVYVKHSAIEYIFI